MQEFGITAFDIIVAVIIILSTIVAISRGFVSEVLSIAAWIGAGLVTYYLYSPMLPIVKEAVSNELLAEAATASGLFLVPLIVFRVITGLISKAVGGSQLNFFDRIFGLIFGVARGVLLIAAGYIVLSMVIAPDRQPAWIQTAYSMPFVQECAIWLGGLLPEDFLEHSSEQANRAVEGANELRDSTEGYSEEQNNLVDRLLNKTQNSP